MWCSAARSRTRSRRITAASPARVVELTLPPQLEEISSTRIREAVDANRDISNLIDPAVQEFIYRRGLYLREPQDKPVLRTEDLSFLPASPETAEEVVRTMLSVPHRRRPARSAGAARRRPSWSAGTRTAPFSARRPMFAWTPPTCSPVWASPALSGLVRQNAGGRTLLISGLFVPRGERQSDLCQLLHHRGADAGAAAASSPTLSTSRWRARPPATAASCCSCRAFCPRRRTATRWPWTCAAPSSSAATWTRR